VECVAFLFSVQMNKKSDKRDSSPFNLIDSDQPTYCSRTSPMTSEELEILAEMRNLKAQARAIKAQLAKISPDYKQWMHIPLNPTIPDEAKTQLQLLDKLRNKWKEREHAYQEARHQRMVALGHEDP
jgi:transcriptional/translational regulatory protein YebC/TACO1